MKKLVIFLLISILSFGAIAQKPKHTPDHYAHAITQAFKENRWEAGKYMLDEAEPFYGNLSNFYELKGWYYYHEKDYGKARYWLSKCLKDDGFNTHARTLISYVEEYTYHYSAAICYINELLEQNAYDKTLWIRKIEMYKKLGNVVEVEKLTKRLSEIYPKDDDVKNLFEEQSLASIKTAKSKNDISAQITLSRDLIKVNPTAENYLYHVNILINAGYLDEALNVCGEGIRKTNSGQLMKKKCDILIEQGKYNEALNFIAEHKGNGALQKLKTDIEKELQHQSVRYDPYIQYQKIYSKTHDRESFNFIMNIALSRGYYYDAIDFINDYKKHNNNYSTDSDLLYKEYVAYHRLGKEDKAAKILEVLNGLNADDPYADELCETYFSQSYNLMLDNDFKNATPKLQYIVKHSTDDDLVKAAKQRLYSCYMNLNELDSALSVLDAHEYSKRADIYAKQGKYKQALAIIEPGDSITYEDISIKYIKKLMQDKKYDLAFNQSKEALSYTDCEEIYGYLISSGKKLGKNVNEYIIAAVNKYPLDDKFIREYCGMLNDAAQVLIKEKKYEEALVVVDEGLQYNPDDKELNITKGIIYEHLDQFELAYEFQKDYDPSILEEADYIKKMQGLQSKMFKNYISAYYEYYRTENEDVHKSQAGIEYGQKYKNGSYSFLINYTAHETDFEMLGYGTHYEGAAAQFGGTYANTKWLKNHTINSKFLYGMTFYTRITAGIGIEKDYSDFTFNTDFTYKLINKSDSSYANLYDLTLSAMWNLENVNLIGKTDLFVIDGYFYINGMIKCNYFPFDKNSTKLYIGAGVGTAPEMTLTNVMIPISTNKLNTYLTGGAIYFMNQHVGIGLTGSWYSLYNIDNDKVRYKDLFYMHFNTTIKF